jgi:arylsulfatase A-like enzyme
MLRLPESLRARSAMRRTQALAQFPDVLPTLLELLGLGNNTQAMHGKSFARVVLGETDVHRDAVISGYHEGIDRSIRDGEWSYIQRPAGESDELYNLRADPRETRNLIDEQHHEAQRLSAKFGVYWRRAPVTIKGIQGRYEVSSGSVG